MKDKEMFFQDTYIIYNGLKTFDQQKFRSYRRGRQLEVTECEISDLIVQTI